MSDYTNSTKRFEFKTDHDNGMLIGPSGCHYESAAEAMYYDQIGLCGCGCPEDVHAFLVACLGARKDDYEDIIDAKKVEELIKEKPDVVAEFVLHFFDSKNLTEHGSSVCGSWLTERGKQFLEIGAMSEDV